MQALFIAVVVVGVVILVAWVLSYRASRIDRLHARVEGCWHALDAVFVRRSEAILELANAGALDPASALLLSYAVSDVLDAGDADGRDGRVQRENELATTTTLVLDEATPEALARVDPSLRETVEQGARQVTVAASFYNDAIGDVIAIRDQLITKVACLAGKAPRLHRVEVVDVDVTPLVSASLTPAPDPASPPAS